MNLRIERSSGPKRWSARGACVVLGLLAVGLVAAATGRAGANAALTMRVVPGGLSGGEPALAIATFTNNGPSTLTHVVVTFTFPRLVSVTAPGCSPATGSTTTVACPLGKLGKRTTATQFVTFVAPSGTGSFQLSGKGTWDAGTQSNGNGGKKDVVNATASPVELFAAGDPTHIGTCRAASGGSLEAQLNGQETTLPTLPTADASLGLPCTPLGVGVEHHAGFTTEISLVDLPKLQSPATVVLTFPDEKLPGSIDNPHQLKEIPDPTNLNPATFVTVPPCAPGPAIPSGKDACIVSVDPDDPDGDDDAGTITLLVQGSGFGDPGFVG